MNVTIDPILYDETNLLLRIRASVPEDSDGSRPLHIGILLDNSGSMEGTRMNSVKRTLHAARPLLRAGDRVTLVTFTDTATIQLREHALTENSDTFDTLYSTIENIQASASTNLSAGLEVLYGITTSYDAVILLTDGIVNAGITSTAGLRAMAQAARATMVFHTLGYGADHNRTLLRELSVQSRGTYTYVDSDEILPLAIGDILSGLRAEVAHGVRVALPDGLTWRCREVGSQSSRDYYVGNMVPDRDYWAVFHSVISSTENHLPESYRLYAEALGGDSRTIVPSANDITPEEAEDQIMRVRVTAAMEMATNTLEIARGEATAVDLAELRAIQAELERMAPRPLLLRLRAQVAEVLELITLPTTRSFARAGPSLNPYCSRSIMLGGGAASVTNHLMARMSSGTACLGNQRGIYRTRRTQTVMDEEEDNNTSFFSTPSQRAASQAVTASVRSVGSDPYEPVLSNTTGVCTDRMEEID